jgi:uncharacterized protein YjbJ (UPF0337 family)
MSGTDDKLRGKMDEAKGKLKEGLGNATGDESMRDEGKMDQIKGKGRGALGDAKGALDKAGDAIKDATDRDKPN